MNGFPAPGTKRRILLDALAVGLLCFFAARVSRFFLILPEAVSVFRPQTALLAGILLIKNRREWVALSAAALAAFFAAGIGAYSSLAALTALAFLETASAVILAFALWATCRRISLERTNHILALVLVPSLVVFAPAAAIAWTIVSRDPATAGAAGSFFAFFRLRSMADAMASLLILPIIVGLPETVALLRHFPAKRRAEAGALLVLIIAFALPWFFDLAGDPVALASFLVVPYAAIFWGAMRFGVAGSSLVCLGLFSAASIATFLGRGPMVLISDDIRERMVVVHADAMLLATVSLFVASVSLRRIRAERALTEEQRRLKFIIESILDVVFIFHPNGKAAFVSPSVARLIGLATDRVVGKRLDWLIHRDDREKVRGSFVKLLQAPGTTGGVVFRIRGGDASWKIAEAIGINLVHDSAIRGILVTLRDVTSRYRAEEELKSAKEAAEKAKAVAERAQETAERALEVKSVFLSNMSHEIRTPLTGVLGMASLLSGSELDDKQRVYVERLKESGKLLLGIVNDILDLEKFESGERQPRPEAADIGKLCLGILGTFESAAAAKGIALESSGWTAGFRAETDPQMLSQIIVNLVGNAVKYTDRGSVKVSWSLRATEPGKGEISISVEDTGIGIPEDELNAIFERFRQLDSSYSKRHEGTGLGLHIVKRLTDLLGGSVSVRSRLGKGSSFDVRIPCALAAAPAAERDREEAEDVRFSRHGSLIIVAEDNPINLLFIQTVLEDAGFSVEAAIDGNGVLDRLKRNVPDLIVMDVQMPGMDGIECARRLRESPDPALRSVPILALTGYALSGERERCLDAGMDAFLAKPFSEFELIAAVEDCRTTRRVGLADPAGPGSSGSAD